MARELHDRGGFGRRGRERRKAIVIVVVAVLPFFFGSVAIADFYVGIVLPAHFRSPHHGNGPRSPPPLSLLTLRRALPSFLRV
jgi:hypothetical protein